MNPDFLDMLFALSAESAEYLLVGAYALAAHGRPRSTGDIDVWVRATSENAERVWRALLRNKRAVGRPQDLADVASLEAKERG